MTPEIPASDPKPSDWRSSFRDAAPYLGIGTQLATSMLVFVVAGHLIDRWLDITPWGIVAGAVLGMVAVFTQLIRLVTTLGRGKEGKSTLRQHASSKVENRKVEPE